MEPKDIDFALGLTKGEGWSDIKSEFTALVDYQPTAAFIIEEAGAPMGMISSVSYGSLGFIGSLIVSPLCRGKELGKNLLRYAIEHLQNEGTACIMLDAVPEAMSLYSREGFRPVCKSLRFSGPVQSKPSSEVRQITADDLPVIYEMDRIAFGGDRSHFLQTKWNHQPELSFCIEKEKEIVAFAMGSPREGHVRVAPWIVSQKGDFNSDLIRKIALDSGESNLALGILEINTDAVALSRNLGLSECSYSVRMALGNYSEYKGESQYAIGSPAKG